MLNLHLKICSVKLASENSIKQYPNAKVIVTHCGTCSFGHQGLCEPSNRGEAGATATCCGPRFLPACSRHVGGARGLERRGVIFRRRRRLGLPGNRRAPGVAAGEMLPRRPRDPLQAVRRRSQELKQQVRWGWAAGVCASSGGRASGWETGARGTVALSYRRPHALGAGVRPSRSVPATSPRQTRLQPALPPARPPAKPPDSPGTDRVPSPDSPSAARSPAQVCAAAAAALTAPRPALSRSPVPGAPGAQAR